MKSFFKNITIYTFGQFLPQALSFLLLPIYISYLTKQEYGIVASFMAVSLFLNTIMQYGLAPTVLRFYYDYKEKNEEFKSFLSSVLIFIFLSNLFLAAILYLFRYDILNFINPEINNLNYIYYMIGYSFFFVFPLINLTLFRVENKPLKFLFFNITQFLVSFLIIYFFVVINNEGALGKIKGEFISRVPLFIISFFLYRKYFTFKNLNLSYVSNALKFSLPLLLQALLWWALYRMDYLLISSKLGSDSLALYNVAFQISFIIITIGISINLAWTPYFFSKADDKNTHKLYGNILFYYFLFLSTVCLFIVFFGYHIIYFLGGDKYIEIFKFLPYLLLGSIFQSSLYLIHQIFQYFKKTWLFTTILFSGMVLGFIVEYFLINHFGLMGISLIKLFTFVYIFFISFLFAQKLYLIKLSFSKLFYAIFIFVSIFILGLFFDYSLYNFLLKILFFLLYIVLVFFIFLKNKIVYLD